LAGHPSPVQSLAILLSGLVAAAGYRDGTIRLWDLKTGECLRILPPHPSRAAASGLIRGSNNTFSYHDFQDELAYGETHDPHSGIFYGHAGPVRGLVASPDNRFLISGSEDATLRLWDIVTGECLWLFGGQAWQYPGPVKAVGLFPGGHRVWAFSNQVDLWKLTGKTWRRKFWGMVNESPNRSLALAAHKVALSPDGRRIAVVAGDSIMRLLAFPGGQMLMEWEGHQGGTHDLAFTPDNQRLVSVGEDQMLRVKKLEHSVG
jgi:WD40 repeat protein